MASIEKRSECSYRITVSAGYNSDGKQIKKHKTINLDPKLTEKQKEKELDRQSVLFQEEVERGTYLDADKLTFKQFIEKWLKDYAEPNLAPKTLYRYKELLDTRIIPALGHIKLSKLQPTHLTSFYNNLRENGIRIDAKYIAKPELQNLLSDRGLSHIDIAQLSGISDRTFSGMLSGMSVSHKTAQAVTKTLEVKLDSIFSLNGEPRGLSERTVLHHHRLISSILTAAVQWQLILINPATRVKPPSPERAEAKHFDEVQTDYILQLMEAEPLKYRTMINLAVYGGMRLGELAGIEWDDISLEKGLLQIRQAGQYLPGEGTFTKVPKNESSKRIISLPGTVISLLKQYKLWHNGQKAKLGDDLWVDSGRLFTAWNGEPMFPDTPSKWFHKFIQQHNKKIMEDEKISKEDKSKYLLPEVNFHGLRHTNATLLIGQGVDVTTVSSRLGHARTSTTTDIYSHALKKPDIEAANKLENLFKKKDSSEQSKQA
ncbi:tyrosine recombinase XerC [Lutispora sp.]|uniref:site-specific integrase n=1 Tax=Lutispora sp. TaxID=2828727 RepID=UPI003566BC93